MKRITICGTDEVIDGIRDEAWKRRISISEYLKSLYLEKVNTVKNVSRETKVSKPVKVNLRARYKAEHPNEMCPQCRMKNKDCECG